VDDVFLKVNEENEIVYFLGTKDTPLERHLYAANLGENSDPDAVYRQENFWKILEENDFLF
jgi:hypothetical protein